MKRTISLFILLAVMWAMLSGMFTTWLVVLGVLSCLLVLMIAHRMDVVDHEGHPFHLRIVNLVMYLQWLLVEIIKSNLTVIRCILDPKMPISPIVLALQSTQETDLGRVIYANSITLTPGTVTIEVDGDITEVHALTRETGVSLRSGEMDRRVTAVEDHS